MATAEQIKGWLDKNADKAGTPDFVTMTEEYSKLTAPAADAGGPLSPQNAGSALRDKFSAFTKTASAKTAANPGGFDATTGRIITGAAAGVPDLGIGLYNAGARAVGSPDAQVDYVGPKLNEVTGGAPLPADAGTMRKLLEAGGSALVGGGARAITSAVAAAPTVLRAILPATGALARTTVAPTVGSHYGGDTGALIANKLGLDPETGALLGSLVGGTAASVAPAVASRVVHGNYAGQGGPNAAAVADAADRQGVTTTAGMVGNQDIQLRERQLANRGGNAMEYINARRTSARDAISAALDRLATARGSTDTAPTPGTIGERVAETARTTAEELRTRSEAGQARMQDRIGAAAPVEVGGVQRSGYNMMTDPAAGLSVPGRAAVDFRVTDQLSPLVNRDASGQPMLNRNNSQTAPYGPFRGWRTDLGRSIEPAGGGRMPPVAELYGPATDAMRATAERQGVPRQDFENVQNRTRAVERPGGDYETLTGIADREPASAFQYLRGGEQNPARVGTIEATGQPQVPGIFGDYLRLIGNETINQQGARGPINLANRIDAIHPESAATIAGPQLPALRDVSTLSRSMDYPTSQTGLGRTVGPIGEGVGRMVIGSETLGHLGTAVAGDVGNVAGRGAGIVIGPAIRALQARILQSEAARNAMAGRQPLPSGIGISDLVAALNAVNASAAQRP